MLDQSTCEAWTEVEESGKIIYIVGELPSEGYKKHLLKKNLPGISRDNLLLEVVDSFQKNTDHYQELIYSQRVRSQQDYQLVTIFQNGRIIAEIECNEEIHTKIRSIENVPYTPGCRIIVSTFDGSEKCGLS